MKTILVERITVSFDRAPRRTANSYNITRDGIATENPWFHYLRQFKHGPLESWPRTVKEVRKAHGI